MEQMLSEESYHIVCSRERAQEYPFHNYQFLLFLEKIHLVKEKFWTIKVCEIIN